MLAYTCPGDKDWDGSIMPYSKRVLLLLFRRSCTPTGPMHRSPYTVR